jgi:Ras-related protein Rab-21
MASNSSYKLVLLGDGRVGKTSLVSRFSENKFSPTEESTVKAQMYKRARLVVDGRPIEVSVWDTAGQERFHALGPLYYRGADGAVLVYDITDSDSFARVKQWVKELKKTVGDDICLVLCGNKCDLERDKVITEESALQVARRYNAVHFYTSAKLDLNVQEAFVDLITRAVRKRNGGGGADLYGSGGNNAAADSIFGEPTPAGGSGGVGDDGVSLGRRKRRGLQVDDGTGDSTPSPSAPSADNKSHDDADNNAAPDYNTDLYGDTYGSGGTSSKRTVTSPPPVTASAGGAGSNPAKSMRVTLAPASPSAEGNAQGARAPKPAAAKKKSGGPACCSK